MVQLRPYQVEALRGIYERRGRALVAYDMGLGKTAVALSALRVLQSLVRVLVIAPKNALAVWERETALWLPGIETFTYTGPKKARDKVWQQYLDAPRGGLLLTNFAFVKELNVRGKTYGTIIVDESHALRNRKTALFKEMKQLRSEFFLELTGSPVVNHVVDLWSQLHLLDPQHFSSFWRFAEDHCVITKDGVGWHIEDVRDPEALQREVRHYMLRKTKSEVASDLPEKIRQIIPVTLNKRQQELYDDLASDLMADLVNTKGEVTDLLLVPNVIAKITRLRQICVTPALVGDKHDSATFEALVEGAQSEYDAGRSVMVFTPFAEAIPFMYDALRELGAVWTMRGGMSAAQLGQRVAEFQASAQPNKALICTTGMGSSFTATAASTAFFMGSAWAPAHNIQCEDRIHRIGATKQVLAKYFIGAGTIDEHLLDILNAKTTYAALALRPDILLRPRARQVVTFREAS